MQDPYLHRKNLEGGPPNWKRRLGAGLGILALLVLIYNIPAVNDRLSWRIEALRTRIVYFFNPPEEAVFVPEENFAGTATALAQQPTRTPQPTPQATQVPLPPAVQLSGFTYVDQHNRWNYCGPANMTMALNYWGWLGDRDDVAAYVKPGIGNDSNRPEDKNVMPYEMEDFADSQVEGMAALTRMGGELQTLKQLLAAGFPVIVEKGYYTTDASGNYSWLGHYQFVTGYDDSAGEFIVQDTYEETGENGTGMNMRWPYEDFLSAWRQFNFLFLVVYPEPQEAAVLEALGPWADEEWAFQHALEMAEADTQTLTGVDLYYAWFNVGTSHVRLLEYFDAVSAYDFAFSLYEGLDPDSRPYRMLWYQSWPYWAYYYSARYQDVINLANITLSTIDKPTLEESLYWRGLAYEAGGFLEQAIADYRETVRLNPNFGPGWAQLQRLGVSG
jgi:tetratricopeptide (TPR) repeat protein